MVGKPCLLYDNVFLFDHGPSGIGAGVGVGGAGLRRFCSEFCMSRGDSVARTNTPSTTLLMPYRPSTPTGPVREKVSLET
jgi:hypothetical protein